MITISRLKKTTHSEPRPSQETRSQPQWSGVIPPCDPPAPGAPQRCALSSGWESAMAVEQNVITTTCVVHQPCQGSRERVPVQTAPRSTCSAPVPAGLLHI
ncbi:unnamed protein product [Gadus morhua 'NCC']